MAFIAAFLHNAAAVPAPGAWAVKSLGLVSSRMGNPLTEPLQAISQFVASKPGAAVHAASMVELSDGRLRAVWFSGSREGARDVTVQTAVLPTTPGAAWGLETTLLTRQQVQQGLQRYVKKLGNPVISRAPDGSLRLHLVTVSLGGWAGSSITSLRSDDEGHTWQKPQRLVTSPFLNISTLVKGAPVAWADGSVALPVYHEFITKFAEILRLDANGRVLEKTRVPGSHTSLQPVVLATSDTSAQMWLRSNTATALMHSSTSDAGQTWQPVTPGAWPNPDSAVAGVAASDGTEWLAINPTLQGRGELLLLQTQSGSDFALGKSSPPVRQIRVEPALVHAPQLPVTGALLPLAEHSKALQSVLQQAGISTLDTAATVASAQRQLCNLQSGCQNEFSYPFLLQGRDGAIHLLYTWHRSQIRHVRLTPASQP